MGYEGSSLLVSMNWLYLFTALNPSSPRSFDAKGRPSRTRRSTGRKRFFASVFILPRCLRPDFS
jgi:hypothetical protein